MAESLRRAVQEHIFERDGAVARLTFSLGVASYPEHGPTAVDLTRAADEALYKAKHAGGDIVVSE